jgi:hypothetical protein
MNALNELLNQARPLVNARALEKSAGLPTNTLGKHYRWADGKPDGQQCHPKHGFSIVQALCKVFGAIEIDGWTFKSEGHLLFAFKDVPNRDTEIKEESGGFEYLQPQWRAFYDALDFEIYFTQSLNDRC